MNLHPQELAILTQIEGNLALLGKDVHTSAISAGVGLLAERCAMYRTALNAVNEIATTGKSDSLDKLYAMGVARPEVMQ